MSAGSACCSANSRACNETCCGGGCALAGAACEADTGALVSSETSIFTVAGSRAVPAVCADRIARSTSCSSASSTPQSAMRASSLATCCPSRFWHSALSSGEKVRSLGRGNVEGEAVNSSTASYSLPEETGLALPKSVWIHQERCHSFSWSSLCRIFAQVAEMSLQPVSTRDSRGQRWAAAHLPLKCSS